METDERAEPALYVLSLRAGLDLTIENGVIQTAAGDDLDVRVEYLDEEGEEPPIPADLVRRLWRAKSESSSSRVYRTPSISNCPISPLVSTLWVIGFHLFRALT